MEVPDKPFDDAHTPGGMNARFFLLRVRNFNPHKAARNCYVYLERIASSSAPMDTELRMIEFKWAGYTFPNVTIAASVLREFDAFHVFHE